MEKKLVLPPMVDGPYEGSLDLLLMQPSIHYKLPPEYNLSIYVYWWGSKAPNILRLHSGEEKVRLNYDVCCDQKSFRKYIRDSKQLKCFIKYEGISIKVHSAVNPKKNFQKGDIIGKFSLKELSLNSHNTFIDDCPLLTQHNEVCGNITAILCYKSESSYLNSANPFISKFITPPSNVAKIKKNTSENIGPHGDRIISNVSPNRQQPLAFDRGNGGGYPYEEGIKKVPHRKSQRDLMPGLFSLVESGAVSTSDLPLLMQIMKSQSPSSDANAYRPNETNSTNTTTADFLSQSNESPYTLRQTGGKLCNKQESKNIPELTDIREIPASGSMRDRCSSPCEPDVGEKLYNGDGRVLCLNIDSITLNVVDDDLHDFQHQDSPRNAKRCLVKQRSKICYMINLSLANDSIKITFAETFLSRQINLGVVTFNCKQFLHLPSSAGLNCNSTMIFRVRSRKMDERMGKDLGFAEFPLRCGLQQEVYRCAIWPPEVKTATRPVGFITMTMNLIDGMVRREEFTSTQDSGNEGRCSESVVERISDQVPVSKSEIEKHEEDMLVHKNNFVLKEKNRPVEAKEHCDKAISESPKKEKTLLNDVPHIGEKVQNTISISANQPTVAVMSPVKDLDVRIELIEGSCLPVRRVGTSDKFYYPNTYVLVNAADKFKTAINKGSSHPKWNFAVQCCINRQYLIQTDHHIVLKVYHSVDGRTRSSDDPLLGFVSINLSPLSRGPIRGWFPVLNLEGDMHGKIKVGIELNVRQKENHDPTMKQINNKIPAVPNSKVVNIDKENVSSEQKPGVTGAKSNCENKAIENVNKNLEGFMWCNQLNSRQSPSASYVDIAPQPIKPRKIRKVRTVAGLNFDL